MTSSNKTPLTLEEKREIQLRMLDEVDAFCRKNDIRYSLAAGTLLGAIRHKGFIPWDDDMDIVMPEPDFLQFYDSFKSDDVRCIDIRNEKYFHFPWAKISDTNTYSYGGVAVKGHGVDIDLYIIHGLPQGDEAINAYLKKANRICDVRLFLVKWRRRILRRFPIKTIPFYSQICRKYRELSFSNSYEGATKYMFHSDRMDKAHIYDYDLFEGGTIDVSFNGHTYKAFAVWEKYLKQRYGDYMQLPPEDQRHPVHGGVFYRK